MTVHSANRRLLAVGLMAVVAGCSVHRAAAPPSPAGKPALSARDARKLAHDGLGRLIRRRRELRALQSDATMDYQVGEGSGQRWKAREHVVAEVPGNLRVEVFSVIGIQLVIALDGRKLAVFDPSTNTVFQGPADAVSLYKTLHLPVVPEQAVDLLLGLAPPAIEKQTAPDSVRVENGTVVATYRAANGARFELGFADDLTLSFERENTPRGDRVLEVRYTDYRDVGGVLFAYRMSADVPASGSRLTLSYDRPIINGRLDPALFRVMPSKGTRFRGLDELADGAATSDDHG